MNQNSCYESELLELTPTDLEVCYGPFEDIDIIDSFGDTLLLASCKNKQLEYVTHYLALGANPDYVNDCGESPIHVVIDTATHDEENAINKLRALIDAGANIELRAYMDKTPFLRACCRDSLNVLELLVKLGCDATATVSEHGDELDAIWFSECFHLKCELRSFIANAKYS